MLRAAMAAFCVGALGTAWAPVLPSVGMPLLAAVMLALGVLGAGQRIGSGVRVSTVVLIAVLAGVGWHGLHASARLAGRLPAALEQQDLILEGWVSTLPESLADGQRFVFRVQAGQPELVGQRVLLSDYQSLKVAPGEVWRLRVRLRQPRGVANPGGFDYEAWLLQAGIAARGYVRADPNNRALGPHSAPILRLRARLQERLVALAPSLGHEGLIRALMLGDRGGLTDAQWDTFTRTGTNHLVVVSGLHVGLIATLGFWLGGRLGRRIPGACHVWPAPRTAAVAAVIAAAGYSLLAGFGLPTQRALIMTVVLSLAQVTALRLPVSFSLLTAAVAVLVWQPLAALAAGFWLSFGAVATLLITQPASGSERLDTRWRLYWRRWVTPQGSVFVGLLVPLMVWAQGVSWVSPLVNFFAIPWVSLWVVPTVLVSGVALWVAPILATPFLWLADQQLAILMQFLRFCARLNGTEPWLSVGVADSGLVLATVATAIWLLPVPRSWRGLCLPLLMPLLWPRLPPQATDTVWLHMIDVGQGLAVLIRQRDHALLYDTGPRFGEGFDAGTEIVVPALQRLGVRNLDVLVISHGDTDHAGGAQGVLSRLPVTSLITAPEVGDLGRPARTCLAGQAWQWGAVSYRFLHPATADAEGNNGSCVLRISLGERSILLPGDIEAAAERRLLLTEAMALPADVLVAGHHGSRTSSGWTWMRTVAPEVVLFSVGHRNPFRHPAPVVVHRSALENAAMFFTDRDGMITLQLSAQAGVTRVVRHRAVSRRYWH